MTIGGGTTRSATTGGREDRGIPIFFLLGVPGRSPRTPDWKDKGASATSVLRQRSFPQPGGDAVSGSGRLSGDESVTEPGEGPPRSEPLNRLKSRDDSPWNV
jgi:hypothetical protein